MSQSGGTPEWLKEAMSAREVTDICLNGPAQAFVDRGPGLQALATSNGDGPLWNSDEQMRGWVLEQLSSVGRTWDAKHPFVDATLPSGHRLHVAFPPLARAGILVSLRRLADRGSTGMPCVSRWAGQPGFEILRNAFQSGDSVILCGGTGSGKTTLATDLLTAAPAKERILALEDTPELSPAHPHFVSLVSRPPNADGYGEVTLRTLLKQALRMRPDRIVLGECRGPEVLDLLQVLNSGHRGALGTLHANSGRDALRRIELLCLLAGGGAIPLQAIRELLACGIQWIAYLTRDSEGQRRIAEVLRVEGREGDTILMRPMLKS